MNLLDVFVDESGNTGDAAKIADAFGGQPSFALVAIGEPSGSGKLDGIAQRLRQKHRIQSPELKSRALTRHPGLGLHLVESLLGESCPVFIELMDKQFYLSTNIVSFFLGRPWLDMASEECRLVANDFADLLTTEIEMTSLAPYLAFAQHPSEPLLNEFARSLHDAISIALRSAPPGVDRGLALMIAAIADAMRDYRGCARVNAEEHTRMLPPPDFMNAGTRYAMLPHVNAFASLYPRVNLHAATWDEARVIHDEQPKIDMILQAYASMHESNENLAMLRRLAGQENHNHDFSSGKVSLSFGMSHSCLGIQLADLLAGACTRRLNWVIQGRQGTGKHREEARLLGALMGGGVGLNIVSTAHRVAQFYSA